MRCASAFLIDMRGEPYTPPTVNVSMLGRAAGVAHILSTCGPTPWNSSLNDLQQASRANLQSNRHVGRVLFS